MPHAVSPTSSPPTIDGKHLYVNDGLLSPTEVVKLQPSYLDEPWEVLRERYHRNGCLLVKGVLPRADVIKARGAYFSALSSTGVLKPGSAPEEGIFHPEAQPQDYPGIGAGAAAANGRPGEGNVAEKFVDLALEQHTAPWYIGDEKGHGIANHPKLKEFVSKLSGWEENTLAVKRSLLRNNTPENKAIGVHYDQTFMRYGEPTSVTAWVPIGDVSIEGGGLIYLEGGQGLGKIIEDDFTTKAKAAGLTAEETKDAFNRNMMSTGFLCDGPRDFGNRYGHKWLVTEYEAGDVVFHTPHMIHASTINKDPVGHIRLGTDLRFVDQSRPWDTRWNNHFRFGDGV